MITRSQIRRQLRSQGGIMNVVGRQKYGLGSFVRKAFGKAKDVVSDVVKSPIGKAAIIGAGAFGIPGTSFGGLFGGIGPEISGGSISSFFGKGKFNPLSALGKENMIGETTKLSGLGKILGKVGLTDAETGGLSGIGKLLGAGGLLGYFTSKGIAPEEAKQLEQDVYRGKGAGLDMIKADIQKYKSGESSEADMFAKGYNFLPERSRIRQAEGGRIGFADGSFPMEGYGIGTYNIDKSLVQVGTTSSGQAEYRTPSEAAAMGIFPQEKESQGVINTLAGDGLLKESATKTSDLINLLNSSTAPTTQTITQTTTPTTPDTTMEDVYTGQTSPELISLIKAKQAGGMNQEEITQDFLQEFNKTPNFKEQLGLQNSGPQLENQISNLAAFQYNQPTGISMANTREQNISANDAQRAANQQMLQAGRDRLPKKKGGITRIKLGDGTPSPEAGSIKNESNKERAFMKLLDTEAIDKRADDKMEMINRLIEMGMDEEKVLDLLMPNRFSNDGKTNIDGSPKMEKAMGGMMNMPMGEPRQNAGGITELDYRAKGGFVPVGIKEKADDVPAMLSKNEFVMTADAVRGAGNGSIEKGAQKMYDQMKQLEGKMA